MLAVTMSKDSRARAVQLPAWNEALGLPRAWDQQWMLRAQQVLAYETDLLEYGDLFEGSTVIATETERISTEAWEELQRVLDAGGAVASIEYMKERLVSANAERLREIESGERTWVGVNAYTETEPSPLEGEEAAFDRADPAHDAEQRERLASWRAERDDPSVKAAIDELRRVAESGDNLMPASIEAAKAGVTTGEWAGALREVFGEYRAPTGLGGQVSNSASPSASGSASALEGVRERVAAAAKAIGAGRLRMLVGKPGLDGHSNAAEQVAVRARDAGFEVVYQGIRLTPEEIARAAADEDVHIVGLSILSGAHAMLVPEVIGKLQEFGVDTARVPIVVGGVIPPDDAAQLLAGGVARVYTPREYDLTEMVGQMADLVGERAAAAKR
jgi:(2R)-ethylmalonyl-CoA mutase